MRDAYANMSAPPRSRVQVVVRPVGKQVVFDLRRLGLGPALDPEMPPHARAAAVQEWTKDFVSQHQAELDDVPRPTGFMAGSVCKTDGAAGDAVKRHPEAYEVCTDPVLAVAILGRVAGTVYVPRRELRLTESSFAAALAFPAKHFPQFGGQP